jgi:hypothetical protein
MYTHYNEGSCILVTISTYIIYCDVFDWSPSLLGNRSRIHGYAHHSGIVACMETNSREARFSIGPSQCYIKKATESRVSPRPSAFGVSLRQ